MDLKTFSDELTSALADTGLFRLVTLETEGPTVPGKASVTSDLFLRFFFNEATGTTAFALIERGNRVWGVDYDNRRGWHRHRKEDPSTHRPIEPMTVGEIVARLQTALPR